MDNVYKTLIKPLEPRTLASWIHSGKDGFLVIDVRGPDYRYGCVRGSINIPSNEFDSNIPKIISEYTPRVNTFVIHCMRSQIRGPRCARKLIRYLLLNTEARDDLTKLPNIYLLQGGLKRWNELYGNDPSLMEPIP